MNDIPPLRIGHREQLFVIAVGCLGLMVVTWSVWQLATETPSAELVVLLTLAAAVGWLTLRIPAMPISFSTSDTFSIAAALIIGPAAGAVTAALDGLVLSYRMQRSSRSARRVLFNLAAPALSVWVAAQAFFALAGAHVMIEGPWRVPRLFALLTIFGLLNFGLGTGLVAMAVGLETGRPPLRVWRQHFVSLWVTHLGGTFAAMLLLVLLNDAPGRAMRPLEVLLLIAPLPLILFVTFRNALGRAQDQIEHLGGMNRVYVATIEALAQTIDAKDQVTHDHIRRVQENSVRLAHELGVTDDGEIQALKAASLLHDVGKISVPEHILNKPGRLNPSEMEVMRRHAPVGADILSVIGFPYPVVPVVRHHHENWDGTGYPDGLAGDAIPIGARILMVADCFDALTSDRPYRPRFDAEVALQILLERRGTMYDPRVVDAFVALQRADRTDAASALRAPVADPHAVPAVQEVEVVDTKPSDLTALVELGRELVAANGPPDVGKAVARALREPVGATSCVLFVYDAAAGVLTVAYQDGPEVVDPEARLPLGEGLSGWVAATRTPIINSDARLDIESPLRDGSPLQSALAVPVFDGESLGGVLSFYAAREAAFTSAHLRLVETAAALIAARVCGTPARTSPCRCSDT